LRKNETTIERALGPGLTITHLDAKGDDRPVFACSICKKFISLEPWWYEYDVARRVEGHIDKD